MGKIWLIAKREYLENVRTKGFWFSVMIMPVLFGVSSLLPILLEQNKSVKNYAVLDSGGAFSAAVADRIEREDLRRYLQDIEEAKLPGPSVALEKLAGVLADLPEDGSAVLHYLTQPGSDLMPPLAQLEPSLLSEVRQWWQSQSDEDRLQLSPRMSGHKFRRIVLPEGADQAYLRKEMLASRVFAYFVIDQDLLTMPTECQYFSINVTDRDLLVWYQGFVTEELQAQRLIEEQIALDTAEYVSTKVLFQDWQVSKDGEAPVGIEASIEQWVPLGFVYLLWLGVFVVAMMMLTSTITEKSNRLVEVLLSSVSPVQLLAGKVTGISMTGMTTLSVWLSCILLGLAFLPSIIGSELGVSIASVASNPVFLFSFMFYFILGYIFYGAVLVGLGSVCDNIKDAQNMVSPVTLLLFVPLLLMVPIGEDPNGMMAKVLSYFPPLTPFVMMNRAAGPPSLFEYLTTGILMILSDIFALWAAAKVFRVGILLTGKPPKLRELWRWVRAPL